MKQIRRDERRQIDCAPEGAQHFLSAFICVHLRFNPIYFSL